MRLEPTLEKCQLRENKLPIECGQRDFAFLRVNALGVDDSDSIPPRPYGMRMFYGVCDTFFTILRKFCNTKKTITSWEWFRSCGTRFWINPSASSLSRSFQASPVTRSVVSAVQNLKSRIPTVTDFTRGLIRRLCIDVSAKVPWSLPEIEERAVINCFDCRLRQLRWKLWKSTDEMRSLRRQSCEREESSKANWDIKRKTFPSQLIGGLFSLPRWVPLENRKLFSLNFDLIARKPATVPKHGIKNVCEPLDWPWSRLKASKLRVMAFKIDFSLPFSGNR